MNIVLATIRHGKIDFQTFEKPTEAACWAVEQSAHTNVYTHLALHAPDRPNGKGSTETALCLPGCPWTWTRRVRSEAATRVRPRTWKPSVG